MAGTVNMRWRSSDKSKLAKTVKNFNAKIQRQLNSGISADILPSKISVADLTASITTRRDFNRNINSLSRFSRRGAEKVYTTDSGVSITEWQRKEIAIKLRAINNSRTNKRKLYSEAEALSRGKPIGVTRGQMGDVRQENLAPKKLNIHKISPGEAWQRAMRDLELQLTSNRNDQLYKDNYLKALDVAYGNSPDEDMDLLYKILREKLKNMSASEMVDIFRRDEQASISFVYIPNDGNAETYMSSIYEAWGLDYESAVDIIEYRWDMEGTEMAESLSPSSILAELES